MHQRSRNLSPRRHGRAGPTISAARPRVPLLLDPYIWPLMTPDSPYWYLTLLILGLATGFLIAWIRRTSRRRD